MWWIQSLLSDILPPGGGGGGEKGERGEPGPKGEKGEKGETGATGPEPKAVWKPVEGVNAGLEQTVPIEYAVVAGIVFLRGKGKLIAEIVAKGILFTLPEGARPAAERTLTISTANITTQCINIAVNGQVTTTVLLAIGKTPFIDGEMFSL